MIQIELTVVAPRRGKFIYFKEIFNAKEIEFSSKLIIISKLDVDRDIDPLLLAAILEKEDSWSEWWTENGHSYMRLAIPKCICEIDVLKDENDKIPYLSRKVKELSAELDSLLKKEKK